MDHGRIAEIATLGGWTFDSHVVVTGADPVLATPWPVGEVAGVALALAGAAAARLAQRCEPMWATPLQRRSVSP
jgi:hypothetical protein